MTQDTTTVPVMASDTAALVEAIERVKRDCPNAPFVPVPIAVAQSLTTRIAELEAEIAEAELRGARLMQEAAAEAPQRVRDKYWLAPIPCAYCEAEIRALDPATIIARTILTETDR